MGTGGGARGSKKRSRSDVRMWQRSGIWPKPPIWCARRPASWVWWRARALRPSEAFADRLRRTARPGGGIMNAESAALEAATIRQQCKVLRLPSIAAQCTQLAEQAVRERRTHLGYLEALLQAELEDREQRLIERRIREARLPRMKTLEEFDFAQCPRISAQQLDELAEGSYIAKAEPIIFIGDSGTR